MVPDRSAVRESFRRPAGVLYNRDRASIPATGRPRNQAMRSIPLRAFILLISPLVAGVPAAAQDPGSAPQGHDQPARVRNYREAAISPDGKRVAWVEAFDGAGGPSSGPSGIFVADLESGGGVPRRIAAGDD